MIDCSLCMAAFAELASIVAQDGLRRELSGVLLDLGVSSPQLDQADRGFSFMRDGPWICAWTPARACRRLSGLPRADEQEIARVIKEYGEERFARRMAGAVFESAPKPITGTVQLAGILAAAHPAWERGSIPLPRHFRLYAYLLTVSWTILKICWRR